MKGENEQEEKEEQRKENREKVEEETGVGAGERLFQSRGVRTFCNLLFRACHSKLNLASQFKDIE